MLACYLLLSHALLVSSSLTPIDHMMAGGFATGFTDLLLHPIDTVKVFQQSQKSPLSIMQTLKMVIFSIVFFTRPSSIVDFRLLVTVASPIFIGELCTTPRSTVAVEPFSFQPTSLRRDISTSIYRKNSREHRDTYVPLLDLWQLASYLFRVNL